MIYTAKQLDLMRRWQRNELKRINLLEGSVSSGKTWISLVLWAFWVKTMPQDKLYLMCAKSLTTLKRNCLLLLQELVGERNFTFSIAAKEGYLFGRHVLLEGAYDERAEAKIRGLTIQGAYADELTQIPEAFFVMLLSRLRVPRAKLIATTNPDAPGHWLKKNYINRAAELSFLDLKFLLDDNTTLPRDYVDSVKKEYTGVFFERFILGNWVNAEGIIYPNYEKAIGEPPEDSTPTDYRLSIDYGTMNAFAALLWEKHGSVWYATREYYYSGRNSGTTKSDEQYANDLDDFIADIMQKREDDMRMGKIGLFPKMKTFVDPSAASFITALRQRKHDMSRSWYVVTPADNNVIDGIRDVGTAIELGLIKYSPKCSNLIEELQGYVWDNKCAEDKPVKIADHCADSLRYMVYTEKIVEKARKKNHD